MSNERTLALVGAERLEKIKNACVAVFGLGGVGGHAAEALARAGVGRLTLIDGDVVSESNINRQLVALRSTVGLPKARVMSERISDIDPECRVTALEMFFGPETALELSEFDYIVDAIDDLPAKTELICRAKAAKVGIISAMGAGNRLHPESFCITDLAQTSGDPLARKLRRLLRERGIEHTAVVWSPEPPFVTGARENGRYTPSSISFVPGAAGMIMAGECLRAIMEVDQWKKALSSKRER